MCYGAQKLSLWYSLVHSPLREEIGCFFSRQHHSKLFCPRQTFLAGPNRLTASHSFLTPWLFGWLAWPTDRCLKKSAGCRGLSPLFSHSQPTLPRRFLRLNRREQLEKLFEPRIIAKNEGGMSAKQHAYTDSHWQCVWVVFFLNKERKRMLLHESTTEYDRDRWIIAVRARRIKKWL